MNTVALVGPPNAGKSTLFNRLVNRKIATVFNTPGVTRDRKEGKASLGVLTFKITDTGGWNAGVLFGDEIKKQIELSMENASVVLMLIDGKRVNDTTNDEFSRWLLKTTDKPVILVVNKCEGKASEPLSLPKRKFKKIVYISAEHALGMIDLFEAIDPIFDELKNAETEIDLDLSQSRPDIKIAVVGRPNAGKSTFLNGIVKTERMITSEEAGTTRDSVDVNFKYNDTHFLLIDTAGIRKKSNINDKLEKMFVGQSIESINRSDIAILVLDAALGIEHQDLAIAGIAKQEYKGIIILINKCDLLKRKHRDDVVKDITFRILTKLPKDTIILPISAINKKECDKVLDLCIDLNIKMNKKIGTHALNKWLREAVIQQSTPKVGYNRFLKLKYMTQISKSPSTFVTFCNSLNISETYQRYLMQSLKKEFELEGTPIKFTYKKSINPYVKKR